MAGAPDLSRPPSELRAFQASPGLLSCSSGLQQNRAFYGSEKSMSLIVIIIILVVVFGVGGNFYGGGTYRGYGFGLGGLLLLILVVLLLTGHLGSL
jgi:hypothetical protein